MAADSPDPEPKKLPPWNWRLFDATQEAMELGALAAWVDRLQQRHRVVKLPPCWPCHEGLRSELMFFWYWEEAIWEPGATAEQGILWHHHLRQAALFWAETYLGCDHQGRRVDELARPLASLARDRAEHTQRALEARVWSWAGGEGS